MLRVLIVDDHPVVRRGLREILADEGDIEVSETADPHEALKLIREQPLSLAVLDIDLPGRGGLELLKDVRRERPRLPVLMLSVYPEEQFALRTLRVGASGYLSKDSAPDDLVKAVRKILRGGKYFGERVVEQLLSDPDGRGTGAPPHELLTDREFQVLCLFGGGETVKGIARKLSLSPPTVSTYRARILEKMQMRTTAELVRYAVQNRLTN
ncbi:MAG TPA: response regulator transcription factor [Pyrinomonadaceae bacterium]|jgi:DNA-binding NarL/FixJ family response regulator|nr:response regulator transcription factor [Pyrinomonadaceae bacterium]